MSRIVALACVVPALALSSPAAAFWCDGNIHASEVSASTAVLRLLQTLVEGPHPVLDTRAFYLVRHQDDARVARINRMAEVVVDWMRTALAERAG